MANNKHTQLEADTQQNEPILVTRMIRIEKHDRLLIIERRLSFLKGNTMLLGICLVLSIVPSELHIEHMYTVRIDCGLVKIVSVGVRTLRVRGRPTGRSLALACWPKLFFPVPIDFLNSLCASETYLNEASSLIAHLNETFSKTN